MINLLISKLIKTRLICGLIFLNSLSLMSFIGLTAISEPTNNQIVARWDPSENPSVSSLQDVRDHLQQAQFPGQANIHHSMARSILLQLAEKNQLNSEYWYLLARSLQHQHEFDLALTALDKALKIDSNFSSAWLLKANVHMAQSDFVAAKKACTQLIGNIDLLTLATCSLEVASYDGKLVPSYTQLSTLMSHSQTADYLNDEQVWRAQVLADMALRLGLNEQADEWLEKGLTTRKLANMPLSFIALWADIQCELGLHQKIRVQLSAILEQVSFKDDALLVRLAMAEKASNNANEDKSDDASKWQELVARRVQLRLQRQDYYHAADIARYYIYVQTSPQEALKWAKINYQQAKLFDDEKLLLDAHKLNRLKWPSGR